MDYLGYAAIGLAAGLLSGFVGVGGGLIIVPALVLFFGMSQLNAQGTSIAVLLPPIGVLAFLVYWSNPHVTINLWGAGVMALMLMIGAFFSSKLAVNIADPVILRRVFAVVMVLAAVNMFFKK